MEHKKTEQRQGVEEWWAANRKNYDLTDYNDLHPLYDVPRACVDYAEVYNASMRTHIGKLDGALRIYGTHGEGCIMEGAKWDDSLADKCTCGLAAALTKDF